MRHAFLILTAVCLAALGCGGSTEDTPAGVETASAHGEMPAGSAQGMPADGADAEAMGDPMHSGGGINAEVTMAPEIADDWSAVTVRVIELATGTETDHEVPIGGSTVLGDSGLTLEVVTFVPDFVMDQSGITTRSAEPLNPAARIVITEDGKDDYTGWLFAAMPEIHSYPHPDYRVLLVEAVPAG